MKIIHLPHAKIDKTHWDNLILSAYNGTVYGLSWFLDLLSPQWDALVSADYQFTMPIPVKRKFGLPYVVQHSYTQQLGVFGQVKVETNILHQFIKKIPYTSYQLGLNHDNFHPKAIHRTNYVLPLQSSYEVLRKGYSTNTIRNIKKAKNQGISIKESIVTDDFFAFHNSVCKRYKTVDFRPLELLIKEGVSKGIFKIKAAVNLKGDVVAALCYAVFKDRMYYLFPISNEEGKAHAAMFAIVDHLIAQASGKAMLFDFEGSSVPGIARFFQGFGAQNQAFYVIKRLRPSFLIGRI